MRSFELNENSRRRALKQALFGYLLAASMAVTSGVVSAETIKLSCDQEGSPTEIEVDLEAGLIDWGMATPYQIVKMTDHFLFAVQVPERAAWVASMMIGRKTGDVTHTILRQRCNDSECKEAEIGTATVTATCKTALF